ncbi:hypothetical protein KR100_00260 [Synechococcus sp. KORDI-100]|uniref:hypothetical protein n=1 Tax=Synechococcus sp. KORDI-100 TaxID=1280380 RepID=UPI0004E03A66|nr:hypothetical protein [Synechococcus sp. KORDI-100]AII41842.1 hypothetical protein KR100_00260 [Synechococcus sp. KORDI-100]
MGIQSLLGQISDEKLKELPGRQRNALKVQQHLNAFALHLQGLSDRAVQEELGVGTLSSAQHSIKRGEEISKKLGLDSDRVRLKVAAWFEELTDLTMQTVRDQVLNGTLVESLDGEGNRSYRRTKHADPRMVAEASRGLVRMASFFGLMDPDKSNTGGDISTSVVFLSPQADLSAWETKTVDVTPSGDSTGDNAVIPASEGSDANDELLLNKQSEPESDPGRPATSGTEGQA